MSLPSLRPRFLAGYDAGSVVIVELSSGVNPACSPTPEIDLCPKVLWNPRRSPDRNITVSPQATYYVYYARIRTYVVSSDTRVLLRSNGGRQFMSRCPGKPIETLR